MKRFAHPEYHTILEFAEDYVNTVVIENPMEFRAIVSDIYAQIDGHNGRLVLSCDYEPLSLGKNADVVGQFVPFEINSKTLQTKICNAMECVAVDETHFLQTQELVGAVRDHLNKLLFEYPFSFDYEKLSISAIIKASGVRISTEDASPIEQVLCYIRALREFDKDRVVILINMRSYYSSNEMQCFLDEVLLKKYEVLLLDNKDYPMLKGEHRLIIDEDLCEIEKRG